MSLTKYTTSHGWQFELKLRRTAQKNIILRVDHLGQVRISAPPSMTLAKLQHWLTVNEAKFSHFWQQAWQAQQARVDMPQKIWFRGQSCTYAISQGDEIVWHPLKGFSLPNFSAAQQRELMVNWLRMQAQSVLIERLHHWSRIMQLEPKAVALSQAKTFWGVCRSRTGIRLNWRLIGAPDHVIDYICIHELSHIQHPNHGAAFWSLVARYTTEIKPAKMWLSQYGQQLFQFG